MNVINDIIKHHLARQAITSKSKIFFKELCLISKCWRLKVEENLWELYKSVSDTSMCLLSVPTDLPVVGK